ncbi:MULTISPECIES: methyltransferase [unclassified Inquilinus]|uniref:methyltransferase n=1 Tax=unclassified Inquilinus TaxID=2645927 RepID=UPI003F907F5F
MSAAPAGRQAPVTPELIMQLGFGFWASKTLLSAVELEVFTVLTGGPLDAEALRTRLGLHPRGARDFFDALVALRLLDRTDGAYANTAETDLYLDRGKPSYVGGILEMANRRLYPSWGNLTEALCTGRPQNEAKAGGDPFAAIYATPEGVAGFLNAMTGVSLPLAHALAARFPWAGYRSVIDIGAAAGSVPVELALAHPHLEAGGFDLPPVRPVFEAYVAQRGLAGRVRFHDGDFMRGPMPPADVLVMGHILHDWDLEEKRMLVAKAHAALPQDGALIVYDRMIDDDRRENAAGLLMSLNMLIETPGGFDYTGADCIGWLREAGFASIRQESLVGPYSVVVGIK